MYIELFLLTDVYSIHVMPYVCFFPDSFVAFLGHDITVFMSVLSTRWRS